MMAILKIYFEILFLIFIVSFQLTCKSEVAKIVQIGNPKRRPLEILFRTFFPELKRHGSKLGRKYRGDL